LQPNAVLDLPTHCLVCIAGQLAKQGSSIHLSCIGNAGAVPLTSSELALCIFPPEFALDHSYTIKCKHCGSDVHV
jgi:hypothetical protein